jgi:hypothetical protein
LIWLACVDKISKSHQYTLTNVQMSLRPKLTPAFYGYDWHSSVPGIVPSIGRTFPDASFVQAARDALRQSPDEPGAGSGISSREQDARERPYG